MDLSGWISHRAEWSPEKPAVRFEGHALSYAALEGRIERANQRLLDLDWRLHELVIAPGPEIERPEPAGEDA